MKDTHRLIAILTLAVGAICARPALAQSDAAAPAGKPTSQSVAEEIGSLRNARVAKAMPEKRIDLTYLAASISPSEVAELAKLAPNVHIVTGLTRESALDRAGEADGVDARLASPEFLARAKKLVWVQARFAGVEHFVAIDAIAKNDAIVLTNFRGVFGPAIADHAMAMLLYLTRDLGYDAAAQAARHWGREGSPPKAIALDGRTMLVVGIGGIGTEIGQRAHGFGMHVIGTRRTTAPSPAYFERVGLSADLIGMLPQADVVAIAVPLTRETQGMFNRAAFAAMKRGSFLINIARGRVVDTDAMLAALRDGTLAGACLDVTDPEPLPADSPLWGMPNVVITPHVAAESEVTEQRQSALFVENIRRFGAGEPLLNVVDKQAGY